MKKTSLIIIFFLMSASIFGQNKAEAERFVKEGIPYHDKGDFEGAITKYDKALELDKDNLLAMTEKALSLLSLKKYEESISYCQQILATFPGDKGLKTVYVTYGNATDGLKKTDKSIEIYDEGIKMFPDYFWLYFNKGIALSSVRKDDEAIVCFQKAVMLNPKHPGSHNAIARISKSKNKRIPSLLAFCRFLTLESISIKASENLSSVQKIMNGNVEEKEDKFVSIGLDMLSDTTQNGEKTENSFTSIDLILSLDAALDFDKKNKSNTEYKSNSEVEKFIAKFETVCSSLKTTKKDNFGFFWEYYVPYFTEMNDLNFIETFSYIVFASSEVLPKNWTQK